MVINVVDLFCGVGGLTKGLELSGLNVLAGLDFDESCGYAYETNNNACFLHRDITQVDASEVEQLYPREGIRVLVGCAPCQPFSKLTKRYRKEEKEKGRDGDAWQSDNKWRLLYSFANLVKTVLPHVISMENVPELVKEQVFLDFVKALKTINYKVSYQVVYCPDYGIPQNRKRLVLLASRLGDIEMIKPTHIPENYVTVRDTIGHLPPITDGEIHAVDPLHNAAKLSEKNIRRIQQSVPGGTWRDWDESLRLKCHLRKTGQSYGSIYGRMLWDAPSPTITTQFFGLGNGRFGHPEQDRAISMREGALLQTFPPDYIFYDNATGCSRREVGIHIGNAVPVQLGRIIGDSIIKHLREVNNNG